MSTTRSTDRNAEFGEYVAARWPRLVRAAVLLGCTPHEAEDVAQTALTRCLVKWSQVRRAHDRDAYVSRVLVNTFTDSRRRRWTGERSTEQLPEQPDLVEPDGTDQVVARDSLERAMANLTPEQRVAVVLRYYLNLTEAQMAETLRVAPGTVKSRISRALAAMSVDPVLSDSHTERGAR